VQSSVLSSQASLRAIDTAKSGAPRALILLTKPPTSPTRRDSRGARVFRNPLVPHQGPMWVLTSTLLNRSSPSPPIPPIPPVQLCPRPHPPIQMLNPTAVVVAHNQPPMSTLSITTVEVHRLRSSLAVLPLPNSLPRMSADLKIDLSLSPAPAVPATTILPIGDHDPDPFLENPSSETGNWITYCKMWCGGLVFHRVYLTVKLSSIFCASCHDSPGCIRLFLFFFPSFGWHDYEPFLHLLSH
jgi:hypothetical protein